MLMRREDVLSVTVYSPSRTYNGFTLFAPLWDTKVWLINMRGEFVHRWETSYQPGSHGILLPNGHLLYAGKTKDRPLSEFGGTGGILVELDWDGKEVWRYEDPWMNHDFDRLANGNTLVVRWEAVPDDLAAKVKGGLPGTERKGVMWGSSIHEVDPKGNVIWEYIGYEHLDPEKDAMCPMCYRSRWEYINSVKAMRDGNILISNRLLNCIRIIDKKSGDTLWKWGEMQLGHPHNATELENGNILIFDNGWHRHGSGIGEKVPFSRILEVERGSGKIVWEYVDSNPTNFFSANISGCQRLPNGNTLICEGAKGHFFEVTKGGDIVWEFISPLFYHSEIGFGMSNMIYKAHRYGPDYPGLKGKIFSEESLVSFNKLYGPQAFRY
jgi:hypothetical protein